MARDKRILFPSYRDLIEAVFNALVKLDGSGTNAEIMEMVIKILQLPDEIVDKLHGNGESQRTELDYQLCWARTYLKDYGAICNSSRGVWMITPEFTGQKRISAENVIKAKNSNTKKESIDVQDSSPETKKILDSDDNAVNPPEELEPWRAELAEVLRSMNPYAFERLAQLLLRECGFSQIFVTKKTGDGGIDGTGKLRINGIFSFNVAFQCKRYSGSVSAGDIRDFRGSLTTDIEKGIFITTGSFTQAAKEEASNAGKQQIDLIDGEEFINKLLEYRIGIREKTIYEVDKDFFEKI